MSWIIENWDSLTKEQKDGMLLLFILAYVFITFCVAYAADRAYETYRKIMYEKYEVEDYKWGIDYDNPVLILGVLFWPIAIPMYFLFINIRFILHIPSRLAEWLAHQKGSLIELDRELEGESIDDSDKKVEHY